MPVRRTELVRSASSCCLRGPAAPAGAERRPQLLEVVIRACCRLHDMHDDVAAVDKHPFAGLLAFDADDDRARCFQRFAYMLRQRLHLPTRFGGGDDHRVVEAGQLADIENRDVAGFDVFEGGDGGFLDLGASTTTPRVMRWHDLGSSSRSKPRRLAGTKQVACDKGIEPKSRPALRVAAKTAADLVAGLANRLHYSLRPAPR